MPEHTALLSVEIVGSRDDFPDRGCVDDQPQRLGRTGALRLVEDDTAAVLWLRLCRVVVSLSHVRVEDTTMSD